MEALLPGTEVETRGLRWEVVFAQATGEQILYRLRCLAEGSLRGKEFDILSPFEEVHPIAREFQPEKAAPLAQWRLYHQAFLLEQALGPDALLTAQPGRLKIEPYQLVPVMRALRMSRTRLMLADGVGLGKTIQAGLVMAELIARRRAHRILIVSPAGPLLEQWKTEMLERFGLRFTILDQAQLKEIRYKQELGANVFDYEALGLISIDFAKQEKVLQELERTQYDIVVIDEAHHCTSLGSAGEKEDSLRRRLAEVLARRSDCLLLLSATPHDGYDPHFSSLIELLDPSLLDGRGSLRGNQYQKHIIRRLKKHIKNSETGEPLFKERYVTPIEVLFDKDHHPHFTQFQEGLIALVAPQLKQAVRSKRYGEVLAFVSLLKRSVSTVQACRNTLETISSRLTLLIETGAEEQEKRKQRLKTLKDYRNRIERFGFLSFEEEQDQSTLEAEDVASELAEFGAEDFLKKMEILKREMKQKASKEKKIELIRDGLQVLITLAENALKEDPKLEIILKEIVHIRQNEPTSNILVYTEYTDSQKVVVNQLKTALENGILHGKILALSGENDEKTRINTSYRFGVEEKLILVSTDATAEGLNLHQRCHHLIHVELPYNPNRLEQRNGRIDRYGQTTDPQVRYLYLAKTFEERLLLRLIAKYEKQRSRLTFVPNTLGNISPTQNSLEVKLLEGLAEDQLELFKKSENRIAFSGKEEDTTSSAYRELLEEIEKAFSGFQKAAKTNDWLSEKGLNAEERGLETAKKARDEGIKLGAIDLLDFVVNAIRADSSGSIQEKKEEQLWEISVSPEWAYGLDQLPGYDSEKHLLRLTTNLDVTQNTEKKSVGFLGRAHPLVRRALDRVRNIQFTAGILDRRVSVALTKNKEPEILFTFLGTIQSEVNREFERVLAVKISKGDRTPEVFLNYKDWEKFTLLKPYATQEIWKKFFESWSKGLLEKAQAEIEKQFEPLTRNFIHTQKESLNQEKRELEQWIEKRSEEICGEVLVQQERLFKEDLQRISKWKTEKDSVTRLISFANDSNNPLKSRHEARGVVALCHLRMQELNRRSSLQNPKIIPLGILMLLPETVVK